jgi:hypothetical protein
VKKIQLKNLATAQRKSLQKQSTIKQSDNLNRMLADAEALQKRRIAKMPLEQRKEEEKECIGHLIESCINAFFSEFEPDMEEKLSHEYKIKFLENRLKMMFENIRSTMAQFRGGELESILTDWRKFKRNIFQLHSFPMSPPTIDSSNAFSNTLSQTLTFKIIGWCWPISSKTCPIHRSKFRSDQRSCR